MINNTTIYTTQYHKKFQESEKKVNKINIYTATLLDRKDQWILTIGAKNLDLLRNTVIPHFHPSMNYRVGL